ncbi:hypothetical protein GTGU_00180, partial [Trabulsiella guamensis ATCC 49490]
RISFSVGGDMEEYATGYVLTAGGDFGSDNGIYYARPLQKNYPGVGWATVAYV